jgi:very-short-patch-repair endonuclease
MEIDGKIARIARRQRGLITRGQLRRLGASSSWIARRAAKGQLIRIHQGVYAVGHLPSSAVDFAGAAVLACGRGAALSHASAAALWGWRQEWKRPFHVTAAGDHKRTGIIVHGRVRLAPQDFARHEGIRVTSPARTLLDWAPSLTTPRRLRRAVKDAEFGPLTLADLADVLARFPRHSGAKLLLPFIHDLVGPTRSEFEDAFVAFCQQFELTRPNCNIKLGGYEIDAYFPQHRLAVELDGWDFHRDRGAFEYDRNKDANLLLRGIGTVRITWERLTGNAYDEAIRLRTILAQRRAP